MHMPLVRVWLIFLLVMLAINVATAARVSDVLNTKHNFSATPSSASRTVQAVNESEICVFCHTPHGGQADAFGPIWNRSLSGATYVPYTSGSLDAVVGQPGDSSRLCLSCHDGTMAIGSVNVINGRATDRDGTTAEVVLNGVEVDGSMPVGEGASSGYTRRLGTDLTNDHPISMTFNSALAALDGELHDPATSATIGPRIPGQTPPKIPLDNDQVQCASCHDPHIRDDDPALTVSIKFLRLNRFQTTSPPSSVSTIYDEATDIICMACHNKAGWANSAHASSVVANELYTDTSANLREFPIGMQVWESSCLACHDTHTVQGSRRLTRGGVDTSGSAAIEETCYACHSSDGGVLQNQGGIDFPVPNIKTDFQLARRMPIVTADQDRSTEIHNIGTGGEAQAGKDFIEDPALMGIGNRHAECTDCHNPHRVIKNRQFNDDPSTPSAAGTHRHDEADTGTIHSNVASGVLRGITGVEPVYVSAEFTSLPIGFDLKRGNPPINGSNAASSSYTTREYQICLKCHSSYAYGTTPPMLGASTPPFTWPPDMVQYTDQAMEYQAPLGHEGEGQSLGVESGAFTEFDNNNHRSWHPVMKPTGRTEAVRGLDRTIFRAPWNVVGAIGNQTMYCSDCHGSSTGQSTAVPDGGEDGNPWGPHGSNNDYILKGTWDNNSGSTGSSNTGNTLCFKCHDYNEYANPNNNNPKQSGFRTNGGNNFCVRYSSTNLHIGHADRLWGRVGKFQCKWCHIAVPHGWKNKALLVNMNDVGPEVGLPKGTRITITNGMSGYTKAPYYANARLMIDRTRGFATSGNWNDADCAGRNWMTSNCDSFP